MTIYCQTCKVNVCIRCTLNDHDTHDTVDIEAVAKESRLRLLDCLETQSDLGNYQKTLDHILSALKEATDLQAEFTDSINNMRHLLKALETKIDKVERDTKNKMAAEIKTLKLYEADIKDLIDSRWNLVEHAIYLVEQASDPETVEREKDFPRTRECSVQNIDDASVKLPDLGNINMVCRRLERLVAGLTVEFRNWNIGKSKILEIEDLQKQHTVAVGYSTYGVTMDTKRQRIVTRTTDAAGPLKVYDYKGDLQESLGAGVAGLTEGSLRGICMDTKRGCYLAPCKNTLVMVDRAGQKVKSIPVGSDNKGVGYHKEGDCYLVSDTRKDTVYLIDPDTSQVTRQIGSERPRPTLFDRPFNIHIGNVFGLIGTFLLVSDFGGQEIKLFDISDGHIRTYGQSGTGNGQVRRPGSVLSDPLGRVVVCDSGNKRVVSFSTDSMRKQLWECIIHNDWGGNGPQYMALDTDNMVVAIVDSSFKNMYIYA